MAIKFNSAYRVCATLRAMAERESGATVDQWATVFGITEADRGQLSVTVARLVGLLREQIDTVESQLSGDWAELRARLTPDVVHSFLIFADTLQVKETQLAKDELETFTIMYKKALLEVDDGYVPRTVKNFLRHQLKIIANGVREYHVQGIQAFQRASVESAIQAANRPADMDSYSESEPVKAVTRLLKKIKQYGSMDMSTEQILTLSEEVSETVGDPWPGWAWYERAGA
jgi:hypothetical protein